jgi:ribosomal protein L29
VAFSELTKEIRSLSAAQISQRLDELAEEQQTLKALLRSAIAREREQRRRGVANTTAPHTAEVSRAS